MTQWTQPEESSWHYYSMNNDGHEYYFKVLRDSYNKRLLSIPQEVTYQEYLRNIHVQ